MSEPKQAHGLIVDDHTAFSAALRRRLVWCLPDHAIHTAATREQVFAKCDELAIIGASPAWVVMDLCLDGGVSLDARDLKGLLLALELLARYLRLRVVLVTGMLDVAPLLHDKAPGIKKILSKPLSDNALAELVSVLASSDEIPAQQSSQAPRATEKFASARTLPEVDAVADERKRELVVEALERLDGRVRGSAKILGVNRRTIDRHLARLEELGMLPEKLKELLARARTGPVEAVSFSRFGSCAQRR